MREIKFRGKRIDNGKWVYGGYFYDNISKKAAILTGERTIDMETFVIDEVTPETVMQYTGLKDKNGKEIYEGDIVKAGKFNYEVIWHNDTASFGCIPIQQVHSITTTKTLFEVLEFFDAEIIGNRYENPELLKKE